MATNLSSGSRLDVNPHPSASAADPHAWYEDDVSQTRAVPSHDDPITRRPEPSNRAVLTGADGPLSSASTTPRSASETMTVPSSPAAATSRDPGSNSRASILRCSK